MITRRSVLVAGGIVMLSAPRLSRVHAQTKTARIGILWFGSMDTSAASRNRSAFRERLSALGYVEGKNILIEERSAEGNAERLGKLPRELVASKVDVIVTPAVTATRAARQTTSTTMPYLPPKTAGK